MLAFRDYGRSQSVAKIIRQLIEFCITIDLNRALGSIADDVTVVAPLKMFFQLRLCAGIHGIIQVVG